MDIVLNKNEYATGLYNLILSVRIFALNTSNRPNEIISTFSTDILEYGDTKAFIFAGMPQVEDYNPTSSLLTDTPTDYAEEFISGVIEKKIPLSYCEPFMRQAMTDGDGLALLVGYINGLIYSARDKYLYDDITKDLFTWVPTTTAAAKEMRKTINLFNTANVTNAQELNAMELINQKRIELAWQEAFDDFSIFTDVFLDVDNSKNENGTTFESALKLSDLVFVGNAKYLNERVVNLMATLLKSDIIDENFKRPQVLKIPARTCKKNNSENTVGFVAHKKWLQWYYNFLFMGSFYDIDTLRQKRVLHFWYTKGVLKHLPVMRLDAVYPTQPTPGG